MQGDQALRILDGKQGAHSGGIVGHQGASRIQIESSQTLGAIQGCINNRQHGINSGFVTGDELIIGFQHGETP